MRPYLEKSRLAIAEGFVNVGEFPSRAEPLLYTERSIRDDAQRIARTFQGRLRGNGGQSLIVVAESHPELPHLLYIECLDEGTCQRVGYVTLLLIPPTRELAIGSFSLGESRGHGFGRRLVEAFRGYIPEGVRIKFRIEEFHTKRYLLWLTHSLMSRGVITDWRLSSPERPRVLRGAHALLPMADQLKIEAAVLEHWRQTSTPVLKLLEHFHCSFSALRTCLNDQDKFVFEAFGIKNREDDVNRVAA